MRGGDHASESHARDRSATHGGKERRGVDPWGTNLLDWRLASPSNRHVSPLKQAEPRVMVETFKRAEIETGRYERKPGGVERHGAAPSRHRNDVEVGAKPEHRIGQERQLAYRHSMPHGDGKPGDRR